MRRLVLSLLTLAAMFCVAAKGQRSQVLLETTEGNILLTLYDDTPQHRDNFLRLADEHFYDSLLFHRVIKNFMVQAGDPTSRHAEAGTALGEADNGYTIEPELFDSDGRLLHHHLRGALAMAREGDDVNPDRASDKFQFYIVTGRVCQDPDMDAFELARVQRDTEILYQMKQLENKEKLEALRQARDREGVSNLLEKLLDQAKWEVSENPPITYPTDLRRSYGIRGGAPWLDNEYTVFGEVVEGMKVVEAIQKIKTNAQEVPLKEVRIVKAYVVE